MTDDSVLTEMATQLRNALLAHGLDPNDPPTGSRPPAERAFEAYQNRGGTKYSDPDLFMQALITETSKVMNEAEDSVT